MTDQKQDSVKETDKPEENLAKENKQETDQEPKEEIKEPTHTKQEEQQLSRASTCWRQPISDSTNNHQQGYTNTYGGPHAKSKISPKAPISNPCKHRDSTET